MPKTYYAVTRPTISATVNAVKSKHFQGMENVITRKKFTYDELANIVSDDINLKLYPSLTIAKANAPSQEVIEDEGPNKIGALGVAGVYYFPIASVEASIRDTVLQPKQVKNIYESIIVKITVHDESCIVLPNPQEDKPDQPCLGVLPNLPLRRVNPDEGSEHDANLRFSVNSKYHIHSIAIGNSVYQKLSPIYPTKYIDIVIAPASSSVAKVANLLDDYHAPKLGLFLTGHWNRSHRAEAKTLSAQIKSAASRSAALKILWAKRDELERSGKCNLNGSFFRRITYAIEILAPCMQEARPRPSPQPS
jgi:hypothetical protein